MKRPKWLTCEYDGERARWQAGDLISLSEKQSGCKTGKRFVVDLALADHVGEFDHEVYNLPHVSFDGQVNNRGWNEAESHYYLSYSFYVILWRWGISVQWRGREIGRFDWSLPSEDDDEAVA